MLLQLKEGGNLRFRCHTGHAYSVDSLLAEFTEKTEETLWSAIRAIEEGVILMRNLAKHFGEQHNGKEAEALLTKADESQKRADLVRRVVMSHEILSKRKAAE